MVKIAILFVFAVLVAAFSPAVYAQNIDLTLTGKQVILHVDVQMSRSQKRALSRFKKKANFYAAVAMNRSDLSDSATGAVWNVNNLKEAQKMAMRSCQVKTTQPEQCVLVASIVPVNRSQKPSRVTLTFKSLGRFQLFLDAHMVKYFTHFTAFAANETWGWGASVSTSSMADAKKKALGYCQKRAQKSGKNRSEKWRKAVIDPRKNRCKILHTLKPHMYILDPL